MPNGWSFNWESMATRERERPRDTFVQKACSCCLCLCVLSVSRLSLIVARHNPLAHKGQLPCGPTAIVMYRKFVEITVDNQTQNPE
jgi:hypothetical protein